jgi:hypothetical protein
MMRISGLVVANRIERHAAGRSVLGRSVVRSNIVYWIKFGDWRFGVSILDGHVNAIGSGM